jgi:hypothetical protein
MLDILSYYWRDAPLDANPGLAWIVHPWNAKFIKPYRPSPVGFNEWYHGFGYLGCYGEWLYDQFYNLDKHIRENPMSRQHTMTIWNPEHLYIGDPPCTMMLHFLQTHGSLDCSVHMRSQDLLRGCFYDIWHFSKIQEIFANIMGVPVGQYIHYMDSVHVYEENNDDECGNLAYFNGIAGYLNRNIRIQDISDTLGTVELIWDPMDFREIAQAIESLVKLHDVTLDVDDFDGELIEWFKLMKVWFYRKKHNLEMAYMWLNMMEHSDLRFATTKFLIRSALKRGDVGIYECILEDYKGDYRRLLELYALYGERYIYYL